MKNELRAVRYAREHVEHYARDEVLRSHDEAMECFDCEAFLKLGLDAFGWLQHADMAVRQWIYRTGEARPEADEALRQLFRLWLVRCPAAHQWAQSLESKGYRVANYGGFCEACEEVEAIVESFSEGHELPPALAELRDQAIQEHRNGETALFSRFFRDFNGGYGFLFSVLHHRTGDNSP